MAGFDRQVYEGMCIKQGFGHDIVAQQTGVGFDPIQKQFVGQYETFCKRCGMDLEEIRQQSKKRRARKSGEAIEAT